MLYVISVFELSQMSLQITPPLFGFACPDLLLRVNDFELQVRHDSRIAF